MKRIHSSLDDRMNSLRTDINGELDTLSGKVNYITDTVQVLRT